MSFAQQPEGWQRLICHCGVERFSPIVHLRWKPGGGVTQEPGGYFCLECHATVDSATLIQRAQVQLKRQELQEIEEELKDLPPEKPATKPRPKAAMF